MLQSSWPATGWERGREGTNRQLEREERNDDPLERPQAPTPSAGLNQSHEDNTDMELRDSLSRLKKKVKHRSAGANPNRTRQGSTSVRRVRVLYVSGKPS